MEHSTNTTTQPRLPSPIHDIVPESAARAHNIQQAKLAVREAEADLDEAHLSFISSAANLESCLVRSMERILDAMEIDVERTLNLDLRAQLRARVDWYVKLGEVRKKLSAELKAMAKMKGVI